MITIKITADNEREARRRLLSEVALLDENLNTWRAFFRCREFWTGLFVGALLACMFDLTDLHICVGECDGAGYDISGVMK